MIISKMLTKKDLDDKVTSETSLSHGRRLEPNYLNMII